MFVLGTEITWITAATLINWCVCVCACTYAGICVQIDRIFMCFYLCASAAALRVCTVFCLYLCMGVLAIGSSVRWLMPLPPDPAVCLPCQISTHHITPKAPLPHSLCHYTDIKPNTCRKWSPIEVIALPLHMGHCYAGKRGVVDVGHVMMMCVMRATWIDGKKWEWVEGRLKRVDTHEVWDVPPPLPYSLYPWPYLLLLYYYTSVPWLKWLIF